MNNDLPDRKPEPNQPAITPIKKRNGCFLGFSAICLLVFGVIALGNWLDNHPRKGIEYRGKRLIEFAMRVQQSNHLDNKSFVSSVRELEQIEKNLSRKEYDSYYKLFARTTNEAAYSYAIPKEYYTEVRAFVGAIALNKKEYVTVICLSRTPSFDRPPDPLIKNGQLICAPGTVNLNDTQLKP